MAMQKAVITGDSPAIRESFIHGQNIYIVNRKNPKALANGILDLWHNPKLLNQIQFSGYQCIVDNYTLKQTGRRTRKILENLLELDRLK